MTSWAFPDHPFNLEDRSGTYMHCRLVHEDDDTITIDYTANTTGARMRLQLLKENIVTISWPMETTTVEHLLTEAR